MAHSHAAPGDLTRNQGLVLGKVNEFADAVIEERLGNWAGDQGFKVERTTMEIRGKCAQCAVVA